MTAVPARAHFDRPDEETLNLDIDIDIMERVPAAGPAAPERSGLGGKLTRNFSKLRVVFRVFPGQ